MKNFVRLCLTRVLLIAAGVLAGLTLAEALVRALDVGPRFEVVHREIFRLSENPLLTYELAPRARAGGTTINRDGMRDREFPRDKPAGTIRVAALGDSVTFGPGNDAGVAWPKQLERMLAACSTGPRFEVLNFGVTGYNVLQSAERLRVAALGYDPDLAIYGYVLNDPQERSVEAEALATLRDDEERRFAENVRRGALRWLASSRLYLLARERWRRPGPSPEAVARAGRMQDPGYLAYRGGDARGAYFRALHEDPSGVQRLRTGLDRMVEAADAAGVPLVLAVFPLFLSEADYPLLGVHDFVIAEARSRGVEALDLRPAFAGSHERTGADFLHPNALGHRIAAAAILERLVKAGRVPEGSIDLSRLTSSAPAELY